MPTACSGDELLEPFRPRRNQSRPADGLVRNMNGKLKKLSRSCSSGISWASRRCQSPLRERVKQPVTSASFIESDSSSSSQHISDAHGVEETEVNEYMQNVVSVVHDDELFRQLKEDMRKSARSGFGSQHVVHKFVEERSKESKRRIEQNKLSNNNKCALSMRNLRPVPCKNGDDMLGRDLTGGRLEKEDISNRRQHFHDLKSKSVPGRQLLAGFKSSFRVGTESFRLGTDGLRSSIPTPPCA